MPETFTVVNSTPAMADQLEAVQRASFPTLAEEEIMTAAHYRAQIERFAEGQFAIITGDGNVVGCSTDFRTTIDFDNYQHRYIDAVDHNWLGNHNPNGDWLYGADIGILPNYRRRGLARLLYNARRDLIRRLNLRGHVAGGMLKGYGRVKDQMSVETYVEKLKRGEMFDPTVSVQLKTGWEIHGILYDYVDDPTCDNKSAFIIWRNPEYRA